MFKNDLALYKPGGDINGWATCGGSIHFFVFPFLCLFIFSDCHQTVKVNIYLALSNSLIIHEVNTIEIITVKSICISDTETLFICINFNSDFPGQIAFCY